jgi:hypothetical protein
MRKLLDRVRGRKAKEKAAQAELEKLDQRSEKGPEAFRRFEEATRQVITAPKPTKARR